MCVCWYRPFHYNNLMFKVSSNVRVSWNSTLSQFVSWYNIFNKMVFCCHISLFTARFATSRYQEPTISNINNVFMHLTNYSVNKHNPAYSMDEEVGSKRYAVVSLMTAFSNLLNMSSVLLNFMCDQPNDQPTNSLIHSLTSRSRVRLEKLTVARLVKKSSKFYGIKGFVAVFVRAHHFSLFWARWIWSYFSKNSFNIIFLPTPRSSKESPSFRFIIIRYVASLCMISGFCHEVAGNCTLLDYYTACRGNFLPLFWNNLSTPSSGFKKPINPEDGAGRLCRNVGKKLPLLAV